MKNWKTTLFGLLAAGGIGIANIDKCAPDSGITVPPIAQQIAAIVAVAGTTMLGYSAKDKEDPKQ